MNPSSKLRPTEPGLAEFLASHPGVAEAISRAKSKIVLKVRSETDALAADLKLILSHWSEKHGVSQIGWAAPGDLVKPEHGVDFLCDRLAQKLTAIRFEKFLETFCGQAIELGEVESRSQ